MNKEPLVGVNIYIKNTNIGTTSNKDGHYSLLINDSSDEIIFSFVGYKNDTLKLVYTNELIIKRDVILEQSSVELDPILVYSSPYSTAENIILKVIENKNNYLEKLRNYSYDAYTKSVLLVPKADTMRYGGILQTLSKGYFKLPNNFQEIILAKKQTKNISEAHNIFTIGKIPNILEETLVIDNEKIISPLNKNALEYYKFNIIDTTSIEGINVFNLEFSPQVKNYKLFSGKISIIDKHFTVIAVQLFGNENVITSLRSNIYIEEKFREFENFFWLPISISYSSDLDIGVPGFPKIQFNQTSLISNYNINKKNFSHNFNHLVLDQRIKHDVNIWNKNQTIPLTKREESEIVRIDSLVTNANFISKLVLGSTKFFTSTSSLPISNFSDFYHFNRVQGNYVGLGFNFKRLLGKFKFKIKYGYGTSNKRNNYLAKLEYNPFNDILSPFFIINNDLTKIDQFYNYNELDLTYQSLFYHNDYSDYYYRKGLKFGIIFKPSAQIKSYISFSSQKNKKAQNTTDWSIFYKKKNYRSPFQIVEGKINSISLTFQYDNKKYYNLGYFETPSLSDDFLDIKMEYTYSSNSILSDFSFQQLHLSLNNYMNIPPNLALNIFLKGGLLFGDKLSQYKFHLPGNYGTFTRNSIFRTISNDNIFSNKYIALFIENNFNNLLFNLFEVPYLKNSKYDLILFFNWAYFPNFKLINVEEFGDSEKYYELGFGIGNILSFLRVDLTWKLSKQQTNNFNFSISSSF